MTSSNCKVLLTSSKTTNLNIKTLLEKEKIEVIDFPTIEIKDIFLNDLVARIKKELDSYDWIIFTSQNAVKIFFSHVNPEFTAKYKIKIASLGTSTKSMLESFSQEVNFLPSQFNIKSFIQEFTGSNNLKNKKILIPTSVIAENELTCNLLSKEASVDRINIYETQLPHIDKLKKTEVFNLMKKNEIKFLVFTSSSTVDNFFSIFSPTEAFFANQKFLSIGPKTSETLKKYNLQNIFEASENSSQGILTQILQLQAHLFTS